MTCKCFINAHAFPNFDIVFSGSCKAKNSHLFNLTGSTTENVEGWDFRHAVFQIGKIKGLIYASLLFARTPCIAPDILKC